MKSTSFIVLLMYYLDILYAKPTTKGETAELMEYNINIPLDWLIVDTINSSMLQPDYEKDVLFYFYTSKSNVTQELKINDTEGLKSSGFDYSKLTKIAIHGYKRSYNYTAEAIITTAYSQLRDVNYIAVDWSVIAQSPWYNQAANNTEPVGKQIAKFIDWLVLEGAKIKDFHLIGHSLGAHVAGFAANYVTSGRITRITGLDPALPLFGWPSLKPASKRLDPTDADVVDCIHTCGDLKGFYNPTGTHDFYPNGGRHSQPGCLRDLLGQCSHERCLYLYAESLNSTFKANGCDSVEDLKDMNCTNGQVAYMGEPAADWPAGLYYLATNAEAPFAITDNTTTPS